MHKPVTRPVVHVPHLHRELAPACLPAGVLFVSPGLAASAEAEASVWRSPLLPFAPAQSAAVLRDLLHFGTEMGAQGDLQALAAALQDKPATSNRSEFADIDRFVASDGALEDKGMPKPTLDAVLQGAQKTLLLAWHLEEHAHELDVLRDRFAATRTSLGDVMGVEDEDDLGALPDLDAFTADLVGEGMDILRPSWRVVLDNMAPFLPEGAALITCDPVMTAALREAGVAFASMSEAQCVELPEGLRTVLAGKVVCAEAPLWQALGRSGPVAGRPWLDNSYLFVACASCSVKA